MTARMRYGIVESYTPSPDTYEPASVTFTLDGVTVTIDIPPASDPGAGILAGDVAWLGQDGRRLVWLGYGFMTYDLLKRRWGIYQNLYDANITYTTLKRMSRG